MTKLKTLFILCTLFAFCGFISCDDDNDYTPLGDALIQPGTVNDIIRRSGASTSLEAALNVASGDLPGTLNGAGPFTVFAPNDEAFNAFAVSLGFDDAEALLDAVDPGLLSQLLTYHVVSGINEAGDFTDGATLTTVLGDELTVVIGGEGEIQLLDATKVPQNSPVSTVVDTDDYANNGIVHFIDKVLVPQAAIDALSIDIRASIDEWATSTPDLSLLVSALEKAGLLDAVVGLESARVLAPNNQAFIDLLNALGDDYNELDDFDNDVEIAVLGDILKYHILLPVDGSIELMDGDRETNLEESSITISSSGGDFAFEDAAAATANTVMTGIEARNGGVEIIDRVLLPQVALDFLAKLASDDLATVVVNTPSLSVLEEALIATDLVGAFTDATNAALDSTATNFTYFREATVFAPSDAAFTALLDLLGDDYTGIASFDTEEELDLLSEILLYHVVEGRVESGDLSAGAVTTLSGEDIDVIAVLGTDDFVIGDASNQPNAIIDVPDVSARNGVAHVVDKVLLPKAAVDFVNALNEDAN